MLLARGADPTGTCPSDALNAHVPTATMSAVELAEGGVGESIELLQLEQLQLGVAGAGKAAPPPEAPPEAAVELS